MPALQVREFPEDLYEELRVYAVAHHRSMAQQTIAAVEEVVRGDCPSATRIIPFESARERESRLAKRQEVLARAARRRAERGKSLPSPLTMLSQARDERDASFDELIQGLVGEER